MKIAVTLASLLIATTAIGAAERTDYDTLMKIRQEGFQNSKVMESAAALTDLVGPRLTNSPGMKRGNEWARKQLADWGLQNARIEPWGEFGRGWSYESATVRMISPVDSPLYGIPKAWTPATQGPVRAEVIAPKIDSKDDLEALKGKLAGKIVLYGDMPEIKLSEKVLADRYTDDELHEMETYLAAGGGPPQSMDAAARDRWRRRRELRTVLSQFFVDEKVVAVLEPGGLGDGGTFTVQSGGSYKVGEQVGVPNLVLEPTHWARLRRLIDAKEKVEVEVVVNARFHDDDLQGYNTIAEIPGTDRKGEIVMLGAHLDSWHAGTGATDNGAGSVAVMEAIRILNAIGVKPRRTIRIALWSGEEQGLLGSRGYVTKNVATFAPVPGAPAATGGPRRRGAITVKPEHAKISAYFNMDNGTGKIRGIYAQENLAAMPIFRQWLEPLHDLGATTVTTRNTGSTDHISFDEVGVPGFQFVQDEIEYSTRTHHTTTDVFERLQREDLMQASVVIASVVYDAAMRDEMMPRKAMPTPDPAPAPAPATTAPAAGTAAPVAAP